MTYSFRYLVIILVVSCFYHPSYGQKQISFSINGQEVDNKEITIFFVSMDTNSIMEVSLDKIDDISDTEIVRILNDSIWMVVLKYHDILMMIGSISDEDFQLLSSQSEINVLSQELNIGDNRELTFDDFRVTWDNITTYGKCTYLSCKSKKECVNNAKKILKKNNSVE